jgi:hypothetical protein
MKYSKGDRVEILYSARMGEPEGLWNGAGTVTLIGTNGVILVVADKHGMEGGFLEKHLRPLVELRTQEEIQARIVELKSKLHPNLGGTASFEDAVIGSREEDPILGQITALEWVLNN